METNFQRKSTYLVISGWIGEDQETRLHELLLDLIGESTGGESAGDGLSSSVVSELKSGTLSPGSGRRNADISWVFNSNDDSSSELELFPGLLEVDDVDSISASSPNISGHSGGHI